MASMTVRGLDEDVKRRFVEKARRRNVSAEALHREVIRQAAFAEEDMPTDETPEEWLARVRKPLADLEPDAEDWEEIERAHDEARAGRDAWRGSDQFR